MSLYPLSTRTRKWPVRVVSHFIGFAVCNSWLEYIHDARAENLPKKAVKDILCFQSDITRSLIASNKTEPHRRGRPSKGTQTTSIKAGTQCKAYAYHLYEVRWNQPLAEAQILNLLRGAETLLRFQVPHLLKKVLCVLVPECSKRLLL